jgi:DNA mismatch endonuclease (patch repair protein)
LQSDARIDAARSRNMAAIRSRNTRPEMIVRRGLHARGLRYCLHGKDLPGRPDLVFPSRKTVLFVHGCFWHAHEGCKAFRLPKTRADQWAAKLYGNRTRDARVKRDLEARGWRVFVVWECEIRDRTPDQISALMESLATRIRAGQARQGSGDA